MHLLSGRTTLKDSLAEVRDQLLREDQQQRLATLRQLAEQGNAVVTLHRMQAAFKDMQAYLPVCFCLRRHSHEIKFRREIKFLDRHSSAYKTIVMRSLRVKYFSFKEDK
ncbi:hypothetical protein ElyMa_006029300 [Elysia marginata]|uniref:Uncharacterized protein n=1 Tax=Elysia marginata TaxID=1093978 RepID=A0AAV4GIF6_9GAST|nr:hypothetical protein ElyMa_006029300 [Elysia marginata]